MSSTIRTGSVLLLVALSLGACDVRNRGPAMGEVNGIVAIVQDELWTAVEDTALAILEPTIFTVRDERAFLVTQASPRDSVWITFQQHRRLLLAGPASAPWIAPFFEDEAPASLPAVKHLTDVWAHGQRVEVVALPESDAAQALVSALPEVIDQFGDDFLAYARERMFASGADSALQDTLTAEGGFSMLFPQVYDWQRTGDWFVFRNHSEMGGTVNRTVLVDSRPMSQDTLTVDALLAWRDSVAATAYAPGQLVDSVRIESRRVDGWPGPVLEVQGAWFADPASGYPAGGPFIARAYVCPAQGRTFFVDTFLYSPEVGRPKYEYMIQLRTLLDTFRCGGQSRAEPPPADAGAPAA